METKSGIWNGIFPLNVLESNVTLASLIRKKLIVGANWHVWSKA